MSAADDPGSDAGAHETETPGRSSSPVVRGVRSTIGRESAAFGFSIMITVTFGVVQNQHGSAEIGDLFLYAGGAVMSFTLLEAIFSRGFTTALPTHRTEVMAVGTAMNAISVLGGVAVALGLSALIDTDLAWLVAPFAGGITYVMAESLEIVAAERIKRATGDPKAEEVRP